MKDRTVEMEVYFDGSCPLCAAEIGLYQRLDRNGRIKFTDVSQAGETIASDLTKKEAMAQFHVREKGKAVLAGAPAFVALWKRLPGWSCLSKAMVLPGSMALADLMYRGFLRLRPLLVRIYVMIRKYSKKGGPE